MDVQEQITQFIAGHPEPKRSDLQALHWLMLRVLPEEKLWYSDGKDSDGKIVSNPTAGYGSHTINYADGKTRECFQVGVSANKTGISVYILGIKDRTFLARTFGDKLGKAKVTGYCIRFKTLADIDLDILEAAVRCSIENSQDD